VRSLPPITLHHHHQPSRSVPATVQRDTQGGGWQEAHRFVRLVSSPSSVGMVPVNQPEFRSLRPPPTPAQPLRDGERVTGSHTLRGGRGELRTVRCSQSGWRCRSGTRYDPPRARRTRTRGSPAPTSPRTTCSSRTTCWRTSLRSPPPAPPSVHTRQTTPFRVRWACTLQDHSTKTGRRVRTSHLSHPPDTLPAAPC
jgi:hypothetical protein